jgi:hypothetical protein
MLVRHLDYSRANQITGSLLVLVQTLIPDRGDFHLDWSSGKFKLNVQPAFVAGEIVFPDPDGRHD